MSEILDSYVRLVDRRLYPDQLCAFGTVAEFPDDEPVQCEPCYLDALENREVDAYLGN